MESFCCVCAGELAGFRGWDEDLLASVRMDWKVVDGLMWSWIGCSRSVRSLWEHGEDGFVVGFC